MKISCDNCEKVVTRIPSAVKKHVFCSPSCYHEWTKEAFKGEGNPFYGKKHPEKLLNEISMKLKGIEPWNKGLTKKDPRVRTYCFNEGNFQKGQHNSPETEFRKGNKPWNKGIPVVEWMSEEGHKKMIKALKKHNETHGPWNKKEQVVLMCRNCGDEFNVKPSEKGRTFCSRNCLGDYMRKHPISKTHLPEVREKISKTVTMLWKNAEYRDKKTGENHPNWEGGRAFEPYSIEFNALLRRKIRKRDNYTCQLCGRQQEELGYKLDIHHIDHNKTNSFPSNLISLCRSCHISQHWKERHEETVLQEVLVSA